MGAGSRYREVHSRGVPEEHLFEPIRVLRRHGELLRGDGHIAVVDGERVSAHLQPTTTSPPRRAAQILRAEQWRHLLGGAYEVGRDCERVAPRVGKGHLEGRPRPDAPAEGTLPTPQRRLRLTGAGPAPRSIALAVRRRAVIVARAQIGPRQVGADPQARRGGGLRFCCVIYCIQFN